VKRSAKMINKGSDLIDERLELSELLTKIEKLYQFMELNLKNEDLLQ